MASTFLIVNQEDTVENAVENMLKWLYPEQTDIDGDYGLMCASRDFLFSLVQQQFFFRKLLIFGRITTGSGIKAWLMSEENMSKYKLHIGDIMQLSNRSTVEGEDSNDVKLIVTYSPSKFFHERENCLRGSVIFLRANVFTYKVLQKQGTALQQLYQKRKKKVEMLAGEMVAITLDFVCMVDTLNGRTLAGDLCVSNYRLLYLYYDERLSVSRFFAAYITCG